MSLADDPVARTAFVSELTAITWQLSSMQRKIDEAVLDRPSAQQLHLLIKADGYLDVATKALDEAAAHIRRLHP